MEIDIVRLVYFIVIPLIIEYINIKLKNKKIFVVGVLVNYLLTFGYIYITYKLTEEIIIYKNTTQVVDVAMYMYIGITIFTMVLSLIGSKLKLEQLKFIDKPVNHIIWIAIIGLGYMYINSLVINHNLDVRALNNRSYIKTVSIVEIIPLKNVDEPKDNTIYYLDKKDNNIKTINNIDNKVDIIEISDNNLPRIEITKYYKSYKSLYDEYYTHKIYVPSVDGWILIGGNEDANLSN